MIPFSERILVQRGFRPTQPKVHSPIPYSIIEGLNIIASDNGLIRKFRKAGGVGGQGAPQLMLVGSTIGGIGSGAVILGPGGGIWAVGSGIAFGNGQSLAASAILQFIRGGTLYQAGLNPPPPPTIASPLALDTDAIKMFGVISAKVTKKRSITGHESNGSSVSNAVFNRASDGKYKKLFLNFTASDEVYDYHGLYLSPPTKGNVGPHYWFEDFPKATTQVQLDFSQAQLSTLLVPTDHFPPPTGTSLAQLGGVVAVLGCYGPGMSPCIPGMFESFPPLFVTFFPEMPVATKGRATDGWLYVLCPNSLNAAILTGSTSTPLIPRTIWPETGFNRSGNACLVGAQLYAYCGKPVRTRGDSNAPDSTFSRHIREEMRARGFTDGNTTVGYDADNMLVVYASGGFAYAYDLTSDDEWSTLIDIDLSAVSAVTHNNKLHFSDGGGLFTFNSGATQDWYFITDWKDGDGPIIFKIITEIHGSGDAGITVALLTNMSYDPVDINPASATLNLTGAGHDWLESYIQGVYNYNIKVSGPTNVDPNFHEVLIKGFSYGKMKAKDVG